jgi:hypothetical protein
VNSAADWAVYARQKTNSLTSSACPAFRDAVQRHPPSGLAGLPAILLGGESRGVIRRLGTVLPDFVGTRTDWGF